jgi:hypothetical protein
MRDRRHVKVIDRDAFEKLAGDGKQDSPPGVTDTENT